MYTAKFNAHDSPRCREIVGGGGLWRTERITANNWDAYDKHVIFFNHTADRTKTRNQ